jgi:hypothetical protein
MTSTPTKASPPRPALPPVGADAALHEKLGFVHGKVTSPESPSAVASLPESVSGADPSGLGGAPSGIGVVASPGDASCSVDPESPPSGRPDPPSCPASPGVDASPGEPSGAPVSGMPASAGKHEPHAHVSPAAHDGLEQHTLPTQSPDWHAEPAVHDAPLPCFGWHAVPLQ